MKACEIQSENILAQLLCGVALIAICQKKDENDPRMTQVEE